MLSYNSTLYNLIKNIEVKKYSFTNWNDMFFLFQLNQIFIKTSHFRSKTYLIMLDLKSLCNLIFNEILFNSRFMQELMKKEKPVKRETKPYV